MKYLSIIFLFLVSYQIDAQELFVVTEPASNAPAGSIGVRVGQSLMEKKLESGSMYNLTPEVTWGINKNLMVRTSAFLSNQDNGLGLKGGGFYAKYRFFSVDDLQSHFRMAAFGRYSYNNSYFNQEAIDLANGNSGYEAGLVATQLIHKVALSSSVSYVRALNNADYSFPDALGKNAINYTFSVGKLMHPKKYTSYKQTNINAMLEFTGQTITENGRSYLDVVPSIQFIINSQARIDLAYKKELYSSMQRMATDGVFLKLEYTFFNVTK
ncbi:hypothetical protein ACHRVW_19590 [Flavobacterium collinsii]|jgi:hypothetical protein|uniref:DUF481 domain-containing protein n=1 Tax=Flavobacterium collinsii TaxID=1114861 RepID=A0A9W4XGE4_9FLAO|nr:hypothetical protein [Flavobacterium collinsii]GIQ57158.1 hypothetical protein Flavo103_02940 [Flavobacterium collinsii]CAA9199011.1 hypothetical protein FLACOL7796_02525 [Flavobacterium collinsii]CAI2769178.1 conserved exported protein of unknown function [Flavobacterium collinsii]